MIEKSSTGSAGLTRRYETLRSLSTIPPDINTYPPVISSLVTHERYSYALSRPDPTPSTSLLSTSLARRPRRTQTLDADSPWLSRSKLGEPDAPLSEASTAVENTGSRWSFWRRQTQDKPLVTSGGGVLEIKSPHAPSSLGRRSSELNVESKPASIYSRNSRPASPANVFPVATGFDGTSEAGPSTSPALPRANSPAPAPAPSGVSRFWGRLGRKQPAAQQVSTGTVDTKDLEISADDFSFLAEIPSMGGQDHHAVGDLLSMEPGRTEDVASLESMLSSKPSPLPAPLAPPPRVAPIPRVPSAGGGRFVAKMKSPASNDMDLLGGLDFNESPSSTPPPSLQKSTPPPQTTSSSMWDDLLAPSSSAPPSKPATPAPAFNLAAPAPLAIVQSGSSSSSTQMPPALSPPPLPSLAPPPITLSPAIQAPPFMRNHTPISQPISPIPSQSTSKPPSSSLQQHPIPLTSTEPFEDFEDFGTPQKASVAQFDDFDFTGFTSPAAKRNASASTSSATHTSRSSLDHTSTMSLVSGASASKGTRWPAPPSPVGPILEPPPRAAPSSGFPFLSPPPPPSRPASSTGRGVDLLGEQGEGGGAQTVPTRPRGPSPLAPPSVGGGGSGQKSLSPLGGVSGQKGLSASDLSFFDSL